MGRNANIGCVACKNLLSERINALLIPFRERRAYYEEHRGRYVTSSLKAAGKQIWLEMRLWKM